MKYLFAHQNFPGQYLHFVRHLLRDKKNEIVFLSEPNANAIPGVRRVSYQVPKVPPEGVHQNARDYELAARRAEMVAETATKVRALGFRPDIIIGHHGWGELLNLQDVWPGVPILGYFEFFYATVGQDVGFDSEFPVDESRFPRIRAMNVVNLLALAMNEHGQTPTRWQHERYPAWAQNQISVLPEGVNLELCKPNPAIRTKPMTLGNFVIAPEDKLVTYVARNLEPYRGFHVMMRALPDLLRARPDVRVVMVGGDDVSYGARLADMTWREYFQREIAGSYDASRVLLPGQVPYETYLALLQRSDAHVYITYPFVVSWSLREAMACGCAIVAGDVEPVRELVTHGKTGLLVPALEPKTLAGRLLDLFEDKKLDRRIRTGARRYAEANLDMATYLQHYDELVAGIVGT